MSALTSRISLIRRSLTQNAYRRMLTNRSTQSESVQQKTDQPAKSGNENNGDSPSPASPISWKGLAVTAAIGTAGLAYYSYERERRIKGTHANCYAITFLLSPEDKHLCF